MCRHDLHDIIVITISFQEFQFKKVKSEILVQVGTVELWIDAINICAVSISSEFSVGNCVENDFLAIIEAAQPINSFFLDLLCNLSSLSALNLCILFIILSFDLHTTPYKL